MSSRKATRRTLWAWIKVNPNFQICEYVSLNLNLHTCNVKILFSSLNSWERASIFPFECSVLNKGTTGKSQVELSSLVIAILSFSITYQYFAIFWERKHLQLKDIAVENSQTSITCTFQHLYFILTLWFVTMATQFIYL